MSIILPATAETFFRDTVTDRGIRVLMEAVEALNVRDAKASSTVDEDLIKQIILNTIGFDVVNNAVRTRLVDQLAALFRELLLPQPR
ncbi:unnamed protein product [Cladocopium goreaui]|uniref:Calcium-binding protein 8 n=1 Tax=Cladocopium goreaui TaxID=2562237 RepID=A0A9P1DHR3_9DINO|nr:unnamed protein product [Cladocopium goreaui]